MMRAPAVLAVVLAVLGPFSASVKSPSVIHVQLPDISPVEYSYIPGSTTADFFLSNPGAELAHWRAGQRRWTNSAQWTQTGSMCSAPSYMEVADDDESSSGWSDDDNDEDFE